MSALGKPFGDYLKAARTRLGLSQADLSDRTKIQRTSISRLESHAANPQWLMVRQLAEVGMGISVAEFFQLEPLEARQPVIQITGQTSNPKLAGLMLKTQSKAIPIVSSEAPLRLKVITDQDITGYVVIDHSLIKEHKDKNLVAWICRDTGVECDWLLVDINDIEKKNGSLYLIDLAGKAAARRAWLTPSGALILDGVGGDAIQPVAFWGRQKDRVEVLGRIIMTSHTYHPGVSNA